MVNQGGVEMRIAIIEDDEITRLELSKLLNTQGYETVLLTNFENLTEELKQYCVELVCLILTCRMKMAMKYAGK